MNNQLVTIFIIFGDKRMIAVHNIYQDSKILASVVCFAELVYEPFGTSICTLLLGVCPEQTGRNRIY